MRIVIQKFGGTSLSTCERRQHVIGHIQDAINQQSKVVVVVSAMGRRGDPYATDTLIELVEQQGESLPAREFDMLLCCGELISAAVLCSELTSKHISTTVFTGGQAGIRTNDHFGCAQIIAMDPIRIMDALNKNKVVIVTGFQGETSQRDWTTLGRGGSDTTATVLGAALKASRVDIFTDVDGILTADPKIVENARQLKQVSYNEVCNMAHHGAKVIHPRAVEVAMQANIPIRVRSTFTQDEGTLVTNCQKLTPPNDQIKDMYVTGIAHTCGLTQLHVPATAVNPEPQLQVFKTMAQHDISVDFINVFASGVTYTVLDQVASTAIRLLEQEGFHVMSNSQCAKVSIIGGGMNGVPGIMALVVETLHACGIKILQSADSNTTIWVLIQQQHLYSSIKALHHSFQLDA